MKYITLLLFSTLTILLASCFPSSLITTPEPVIAKIIEYDFVPPSKAEEKTDLSLIILNPEYAKGFEYEKQSMFVNFIDNMGVDFEEMLIAKGYSLRGPFDTYDEIVYADKSETDLMLKIEIDFSYEWAYDAIKDKPLYGYKGSLSGYSFQRDGNLSIGGKINLTIKESLTQEKLWVKSIKLDKKNVGIHTARYRVQNKQEGMNAIASDPQYVTVMYEALDSYYQKALKTAWNHLEPAELEPLKTQVKDLRSKKGY
ncbi:MAG: hypothetical protein HWE22_06255 [Flavobacteriales bacterium]|nr:hypothetical protein [Flavobacteriales bacterium]